MGKLLRSPENISAPSHPELVEEATRDGENARENQKNLSPFHRAWFRHVIQRTKDTIFRQEPSEEEERALQEYWRYIDKVEKEQKEFLRTIEKDHMKAMRKLSSGLLKVLGIGARAAVLYGAFKLGEGVHERFNEKDVLPTVSLTELDPGAKQERMHRLLHETLPRGWGEAIGNIEFVDRDGEPMTHYGMPESTPFAEEHRVRVWNKARIRFFKKTKHDNLYENFNATLVHEVAHANDWYDSPYLSGEEKDRLEEAIVSRVTAADRYRSSYVEAIKIQNKTLETDSKAVEYWAEIVEAYLGKGVRYSDGGYVLEQLPEADRVIVEEVIRKIDPNFDRDAALDRRIEILSEMERERDAVVIWTKAEKEIGRMGLGADEEAELVDWLHLNIKQEAAERSDFELQRQGRRELAHLLRSFGTDFGNKIFAYEALGKYVARERLLADLRANNLFNTLVDLYEYERCARMTSFSSRFSKKEHMVEAYFLENLAIIVRKYNVVFGERVALDNGEYADLLDWQRGDDWSPVDWIVQSTNWTVAEQDSSLATEVSARSRTHDFDRYYVPDSHF